MATTTVAHLADLEIGKPGEDRITSHIDQPEQRQEFAHNLSTHTAEITNPKTVVCMEDRPDVGFADGKNDPAELREQAFYQWPGGLVLAATKAGVAANAAFLRDATTMQQAYELTFGVLTGMGYEDGGHAGCGASGKVEASIVTPVPREIALPTLGALTEMTDAHVALFDRNAAHKQALLDKGFYSGWTQAWHESFLQEHAPQNFSFLRTEHNPVHGHAADGVFILGQLERGFAKNAFFEDTGQMSFAVTPPKVMELAQKLGGTDEERQALLVAFCTDLLDVSAQLVAPGMPAFVEAA